MFFIIKESKETVLEILKETVKVLWFYFVLNYHAITQYNTLNVKLSNSPLNKLKYETKNDTEVYFSSNMIGDSKDETIFHTNCY